MGPFRMSWDGSDDCQGEKSYNNERQQVSRRSKPVTIPPSKAEVCTQLVKPQYQSAAGKSTGHRNAEIPPAVAALLRVTSIPRRREPNDRGKRHKSRGTAVNGQHFSFDDLVQEWKEEEKEAAAAGCYSRIGSLLDPLGTCEASDFSSYSSDSMSVPSLDGDWPSPSSLTVDPATPPHASLSPRRYAAEKKERGVSLPLAEDCLLDHPLLPSPAYDVDHENSTLANTSAHVDTNLTQSPRSFTFKSVVKSNLAASLQALKSAAKSFSNFSAPIIPPEDLLTSSFLSPRIAREMRPKPLHELPTAAMRRYLNPSTKSLPLNSSVSLPNPFWLNTKSNDSTFSATATNLDLDDEKLPMIQMTTYEQKGSPSPSSPNNAQKPGTGLTDLPSVRQREPRENSDFLRVIVLEMNMRRKGKLDARAMGKAKYWLPPRKTGSIGCAGMMDYTDGVPERWKGVSVDDS